MIHAPVNLVGDVAHVDAPACGGGRRSQPSAHETSPTASAPMIAEPSDATVKPGTKAAANAKAAPFTTR